MPDQRRQRSGRSQAWSRPCPRYSASSPDVGWRSTLLETMTQAGLVGDIELQKTLTSLSPSDPATRAELIAPEIPAGPESARILDPMPRMADEAPVMSSPLRGETQNLSLGRHSWQWASERARAAALARFRLEPRRTRWPVSRSAAWRASTRSAPSAVTTISDDTSEDDVSRAGSPPRTDIDRDTGTRSPTASTPRVPRRSVRGTPQCRQPWLSLGSLWYRQRSSAASLDQRLSRFRRGFASPFVESTRRRSRPRIKSAIRDEGKS
jgi:hypothetical protein